MADNFGSQAKITMLGIIVLIYLISPVDFIPDGLPLGFIDDLLVGIIGGGGIAWEQLK